MQRILYVAGAAHCGSTLLDLMLGAAPDVCNVGQLADLHQFKGSLEDGSSPDPFWSSVFDAPEMPTRAELARWGRFIAKEQGLPRLLLSPSLCRQYAAVQDHVFGAIFQVSGAHTVVDSSKNMARAVALLRSSQYDVRVLHLVRDPRGYINSNNKRRRERGASPSFGGSMLYWLFKNAVASFVLRPMAGARYCRVSYEDLLVDPEGTLKRIGGFADIDTAPIAEKVCSESPFQPRRIFSGNRISQRRAVTFDPSRTSANRLQGMDEGTFWYTFGWPSALWGYEKEPSYRT